MPVLAPTLGLFYDPSKDDSHAVILDCNNDQILSAQLQESKSHIFYACANDENGKTKWNSQILLSYKSNFKAN